MSKVLYIKANAKPEGESRTFMIADKFVEAYKKHHPQDEIITLDLYKEDIHFLTVEDVMIHMSNEVEETENAMKKYALQFKSADKYIFAEPMWNLGVPAILKAYIDYVSIPNITFKYGENGPIGLCQGKKALNVITSGGDYSEGMAAEWDLCDKYLKTIMGLFGVLDYTTIRASNLDVIGMDVDAIVNKAIKEAEELAKTF
ncbi:MAG TPA: NAD(P)H-dependent oxidoreductase [Paludibacteraceae bacterium]|jgi:FMN-dependent NADH-azoreductase|nr:NAD(P)H-dependent oxidoreductase [Paludibacteraceae bacterium]OPZ01483.1 MAG: FMN-dependent NADH-azoreductase [Bacteroidetes bacterium ADurb.BinA395]MBP8967319.1 NAD(P)H-dependent oxidoreductase [Paludibacteraceae bacterium]HOF98384.1 NAD(P)H-dependent oxidoreductase [Paludibacteraceae bacterium]HOJ65504.1 NAD(P)H-dependent oxidoreductase [Paludibacteraceae bacterium]